MSVDYKSNASKVGVRIRKARMAAGLSQERLAASIKTSRRNVLRWEGGYNLPRPEHIAAIARETDRSTDYFLNGDEDDEEADLVALLMHTLRDVVRHEIALARPVEGEA